MDSPDPDPDPAPTPQVHEIGSRTYLVAEVQPLDVTGVRTVGVGALIFLIAALAQLPFLDDLRADDRMWWFWTCVTGFGLGLLGFEFCRRRAQRLGIAVHLRPTEGS